MIMIGDIIGRRIDLAIPDNRQKRAEDFLGHQL